jgi:hypothetical protein
MAVPVTRGTQRGNHQFFNWYFFSGVARNAAAPGGFFNTAAKRV